MNLVAAFTYAPLAVFLLMMPLFVRRIGVGVRAQALWAILLLLAYAKFLCFATLGGHAFSPNLPEILIWLWDGLYSGAMILFALSLLTCFWRGSAKKFLLPFVAWGLSAWGLYAGLSAPAVHEITLTFPNLPAALEGYRIVLLADIHCSHAARRWRTQAIVDAANALDPDLICLTGDNVDGQVADLAPDVMPLSALRARDGVYACMGNHAYYHDFFGWRDFFSRQMPNIRFLQNAWVSPHAGLVLAGTPDRTGLERGGLDVAPDVAKAFAAAPKDAFRVLLQHRPAKAAENIARASVDLQLSGHTHGGIAPVLRNLVALHNGGFVRGAYALGKSILYVSPGAGQWAGFPMRFFNPSEISLVILRRGKMTVSI